jgi:hypothetical protein
MRKPQEQKPLDDPSHSLAPFEPNQTLIAVIERSRLVAGIIPGVKHQPLKKLATDENELSFLNNGERKPARQGTRSTALPSPSRPAGTASGWPAG